MRIIYLDSGRLPTEKAHGLQIMKMCEAFASQHGLDEKIEVELVISSRKNPDAVDPFDYYQVKRNFRLKKLWSLDLVNIVPKYGSWLSRLSFILAAKRYLRSQKYDVLYLREHLSGLFFRDFVLEVHVLPDTIRPADLKVWQRARKLIVLTSHLKKFLIEHGISGEKILVAPDAVDIKKFEIRSTKSEMRKELGLPQDKQIVMYTGHVYEWKGAQTLLAAAKLFQRNNAPSPLSPPTGGEEKGGGRRGGEGELLFLFVGGTEWDLKRFRPLAEGVENAMLLGQKPYRLIPKYLAAADVLVLPNSGKSDISRYYTSPLKMFEYMASGKPIVASDLPSIREVLNENNAILVTPDDPAALASGIKKLLQHSDLATKLASQARLDVAKYNWLARARKILEFIK